MNNIIRRKWNRNSITNIEDLRGAIFQAEEAGHTFEISGVDSDGNAIALSGTPSGVMLRPDNTDVALDCAVSGGVVTATLPAECYDVQGRFGITIYLTSDEQKTAIYAAVGSVARTSSGNASPETTASVVDLINDIEAAIAEIPASDTNLKGALAPTYSTSAVYPVGSYAWYDGKLYRCTTAITTGETWTSAHWMEAKLGQDVCDLKSAIEQTNQNLSKIYDNGQLLTITQQAMLHPVGDGTFTISGDTINYQEVTNQQNVIGFTFASEVGKQYTVSCGLEFQSGNMALYAVKGTTVSTTVYDGRIDPISASGTYSFTFTASTGTTTIWVICQSAVNSAVISNLLCSAGWGYKSLDTTLTKENFPAQGKAVGELAKKVSEVNYRLNEIIVDDNLIEISALTLQHTAGTATASYNYPNGFSTSNTGNDNNLFGFVINTKAKDTYYLRLKVEEGPAYRIYICPGDIYNAGGAIHVFEDVAVGTEIDYEFDAVTEKTSVWFSQKYNVSSIGISNIYVGDDILRYHKDMMDYEGTEIEVFNKILCIGDSLTEGTFNYESGGSVDHVFTDARYSYPTFLKKLTGSEIVNYGHGGYTAEEWYELYENEDLSGYDACIIMLGVNDSIRNVGVSNFTASMTNIIDKMMDENKGIKVFVATIIPAYTDYDPNNKFTPYNNEIKRLVNNDFTDAFLIDINKYSLCKFYTYYAQGHLTAIGYQQLAKEFYTMISYIIHNNLQAFRNVQFIGTDYTYPDFADD